MSLDLKKSGQTTYFQDVKQIPFNDDLNQTDPQPVKEETSVIGCCDIL